MFPVPEGQAEPVRAHKVIVDFTRAFFDTQLNGIASPLLRGEVADYAEVTFRSGGNSR